MIDNREVKQQRLTMFDGTALSDATYNLVIGLTLLWGVALNIVMATFFSRPILSLPYLAVIVIYFAGSIGSMMAVYRSRVPSISFLGFTGLSLSMGLLLTYYVQWFDLASIAQAFWITGMVVALMLVASTLFHDFFRGIGRMLGLALLTTLVVEVVMMLFGRGGGAIDWVVVLIFCGYIGYDWARAQEYPATLDNAIDSAADIYVDIVNLFVRILAIIGNKRD